MPTKFQIYVDQPMPPPAAAAGINAITSMAAATTITNNTTDPKGKFFPAKSRLFVDERKLYPVKGEEMSIEEIEFPSWVKRQKALALQRENEILKQKIMMLEKQISVLQEPIDPPSAQPGSNRLSIVPQSLQPTQGLDYDASCQYGAFNEVTTVVHDCWKNTGTVPIPISNAQDKFTLPINNSQWMKDNVPASTPNYKRDDENRKQGRRLTRPSMGGSPTLKLSPITETSRECNSKSSSSCSGARSGKKQKGTETDPIPDNSAYYRDLLMGLIDDVESIVSEDISCINASTIVSS